MVTTINNEKYAVTAEGRVIAILLRVFAVSVFGFITASIASYLIGKQAAEQVPVEENGLGTEEHLAALRTEQAALRQEVAALREAIERRGLPGHPTPEVSSPPNERLLSKISDPAATPGGQTPKAQ